MEIVERAKLYVIDFFTRHREPNCCYHTLEHTMRVVDGSNKIAAGENLEDREMQALLVAAWFHDIAYPVQQAGHEQAGIAELQAFFKANPVGDTFRETAERCINATKRDHEPETLPEKIMMDADVAHIASPDFINISKSLRKERSGFLGQEIPALDYWKETLSFLDNQQFYTAYAREHFLSSKQENTEKVKTLIAELEQKPKSTSRSRLTERGTESMFRLTASNQIRLSMMADKKANILISINSILVSMSAVLGTSGRFSGSLFSDAAGSQIINNELAVPLSILFFFSLISLVLAIISCRPKLNDSRYTDQDVKERRVNLLFFGDFHQIPFPVYEQSVKEMISDYDYLYSSLIRDQYFLGKSLIRKYKLLRAAYNIFMYGFVIAAVSYFVLRLI